MNVRNVICLLLCLFWLGIQSGRACQICVPWSSQSVADHLLSASTVVMAREDPERPFRFSSTRVLKGKLKPNEDFGLLLNTSMRRLMLADAKMCVILAKTADGVDEQWRLLATTRNGEFLNVVRETIKRAQRWKKNPDQRCQFFAGYLGHEDEQLHKLAHIELTRAPYSVVKQLGEAEVLPFEEVRAFLADPQYIEWHALYLLLLAQSEAVQDREYIVNSFYSAEKFGITTLLRARTTAMIEVQGEKALNEVDARYFNNKSKKQAEVAEVLRALLSFADDPVLGDRVVKSRELAQKNFPDVWRKVSGGVPGEDL